MPITKQERDEIMRLGFDYANAKAEVVALTHGFAMPEPEALRNARDAFCTYLNSLTGGDDAE